MVNRSFHDMFLIKFNFIFFILLFLSSCSQVTKITHVKVKKEEIKSLEYRISPIIDSFGKSNLSVKLTINFDFKDLKHKKLLEIKLPEKFGPVDDLYKEIKDLKVLTQGIKLKNTKDNSIKQLRNIKRDTVTLNYTLVPTVDANQDCRETKVYYRPLITKDFFHVIGHGLFILPGCFELDSRVSVNIYWEGFDTNYSLANSHGVNNHVQKLNISVQELLHAVYTGGDFRIYKIECKQAPIFVAIRGNWLFKDTDFVLMVNKIISAQREFWNDYDFPYFLITVIPVIKSENICMTGGTGLENSFAMFLGSKKFMTLHKLAWTISHEHFHTWNGRKIGRQEPEALIYWFAEGFTSYYTVLLNLRAGIYTIDNYVKEYNKTLLNYFISPVRNEENIEILKKFWVNHDIEHLPYYRGTILAHEWNLHIKKESKERYSLDNVMFDILYQAQKNKRVFTAELFDNVIKKYLKEGVAQEIDMYIDRGETIELSPDALGPCFMLAWEKKKIKDKEFIVPYYYCDSSHKLNCAVCKKWFGIK